MKEKQDYEIFDMTGKKVLSGTMASGEKADISFFTKGIYFIKVTLPSGNYSTTKLLKE